MPGDPVVGSTVLRRPAIQSPNFLTGLAFEPPAYSATQSGASGSGCEIYSGKSVSGSTPAVIGVEDSTESGIAGGLVDVIAGEMDLTGNMVIAGTLSVGGSTNTGNAGLTDGTISGSSSTTGLPNGGIQGTSGAQSAGTAHTHGPGSYSVTNGQHSHAGGSYAVANGSHHHAL
jgi:hypothetical protein